MTCGKRLAPGQWWNFCGETDMGQTMPVQCTECGGEYPLAQPVQLVTWTGNGSAERRDIEAPKGYFFQVDRRKQPEQEPAAWLTEERYAQLHTAQRPWVGLTAEEIHDTEGYKETREMYRFARNLEAKLKAVNGFHSTEKNA